VATPAASSAKVAVKESGEVGRSAVIRRIQKRFKESLRSQLDLYFIRIPGSLTTICQTWVPREVKQCSSTGGKRNSGDTGDKS
jgi:hypothetical protein